MGFLDKLTRKTTTIVETTSESDIQASKYELNDKKGNAYSEVDEKGPMEEVTSQEEGSITAQSGDHTFRKLKPRHIQLIGIGGSIGTALFVAIGGTLQKAGPLGLLLAFSTWCIVVLNVTNCSAEMVSYLPIQSPFVALAGRCIDDAFEVMTGWNFFIYQAFLIPFEITAANSVLHFWIDGYSPAIPISIQLVLYFGINMFAVRMYGESEYWLSMGKVILAIGLMFFTFVVMVGGNPKGDAFGFRYWKNPGVMNEYNATGDWGRFLGYFAAISTAAYTIAGPEYVSMAAGEAEDPYRVMPKAFKAVFYRLTTFYILGALCVGILVPYNDPTLATAIDEGRPGAAASPYVIAMTNLNIRVLPHIVNALILTSVFSAGNSFVYCSSRSLYGLALEGKAPKFLTQCTKSGVPYWTVLVSLGFGCLSFLQLGSEASKVLDWMISVVTASQLINFWAMCLIYYRFWRACNVQGLDRKTFPYFAYFQPYSAYIGMFFPFVVCFCSGYAVFLDFDIASFLFSYIMIPVCFFVYLGWKIWFRCPFKKLEEIDLQTGKAEIAKYYESYIPPPPPKTWYGKVGSWIIGN